MAIIPGRKNFDDEDIIPIIEKVTGASLSDFFHRYVAGTEELPVKEMLENVGLRLVFSPEFGARIRKSQYKGGTWLACTEKERQFPVVCKKVTVCSA